MNQHTMQFIAGSASGILFASGTLSMLVKAWRTKDMESYSIPMLVLNNLGNMVYWVYVVGLPPGPIYAMHGFYTVATLIMLAWALLYRQRPQTCQAITKKVKHFTTKLELPRLGASTELPRFKPTKC